MKTLSSLALAALLAAAPVAFAQAQAGAQTADPVASAAATVGPTSAYADSIVQALLADPSLADAKITVAPDDTTITLTGVTKTRDQMKRVLEIVGGFAGERRVINVIQPERM